MYIYNIFNIIIENGNVFLYTTVYICVDNIKMFIIYQIIDAFYDITNYLVFGIKLELFVIKKWKRRQFLTQAIVTMLCV